MQRPLLAATLLALSCLSATRIEAQAAGKVSFIPGVRLTALQASAVDSLARALHAEAKTRVIGGALPDATRLALREKYLNAVRAVLTPSQRAAFDANYLPAEAQFEARRRSARGVK